MGEKLCDYGCEKLALYQFKNGKRCCERNHSLCPGENKKVKGRKKPRIIRRENPGICDYGCGKPSLFYFPTTNKWCCSIETCKCEKIRNRTSNSLKGKPISKESIKKANLKRIGKPSGMKDKHHTLESKKNISIKLTGRKISEEDIIKRKKSWTKERREKARQYMLNGHSLKMNKNNGIKNNWVKPENLTEWELYNRLVWRITNKSSIKKYTKTQLKQRGRKKDLGHKNLDHVFSIHEGFKLGILPIIIGCESNIELVECHYNYTKHSKCDITIEELFSRFNKEKNERIN